MATGEFVVGKGFEVCLEKSQSLAPQIPAGQSSNSMKPTDNKDKSAERNSISVIESLGALRQATPGLSELQELQELHGSSGAQGAQGAQELIKNQELLKNQGSQGSHGNQGSQGLQGTQGSLINESTVQQHANQSAHGRKGRRKKGSTKKEKIKEKEPDNLGYINCEELLVQPTYTKEELAQVEEFWKNLVPEEKREVALSRKYVIHAFLTRWHGQNCSCVVRSLRFLYTEEDIVNMLDSSWDQLVAYMELFVEEPVCLPVNNKLASFRSNNPKELQQQSENVQDDIHENDNEKLEKQKNEVDNENQEKILEAFNLIETQANETLKLPSSDSALTQNGVSSSFTAAASAAIQTINGLSLNDSKLMTPEEELRGLQFDMPMGPSTSLNQSNSKSKTSKSKSKSKPVKLQDQPASSGREEEAAINRQPDTNGNYSNLAAEVANSVLNQYGKDFLKMVHQLEKNEGGDPAMVHLLRHFCRVFFERRVYHVFCLYRDHLEKTKVENEQRAEEEELKRIEEEKQRREQEKQRKKNKKQQARLEKENQKRIESERKAEAMRIKEEENRQRQRELELQQELERRAKIEARLNALEKEEARQRELEAEKRLEEEKASKASKGLDKSQNLESKENNQQGGKFDKAGAESKESKDDAHDNGAVDAGLLESSRGRDTPQKAGNSSESKSLKRAEARSRKYKEETEKRVKESERKPKSSPTKQKRDKTQLKLAKDLADPETAAKQAAVIEAVRLAKESRAKVAGVTTSGTSIDSNFTTFGNPANGQIGKIAMQNDLSTSTPSDSPSVRSEPFALFPSIPVSTSIGLDTPVTAFTNHRRPVSQRDSTPVAQVPSPQMSQSPLGPRTALTSLTSLNPLNPLVGSALTPRVLGEPSNAGFFMQSQQNSPLASRLVGSVSDPVGSTNSAGLSSSASAPPGLVPNLVPLGQNPTNPVPLSGLTPLTSLSPVPLGQVLPLGTADPGLEQSSSTSIESPSLSHTSTCQILPSIWDAPRNPDNISMVNSAKHAYICATNEGLTDNGYVPTQVLYNLAIDSAKRRFSQAELLRACTQTRYDALRDEVGLITHIKLYI